MSRSGVKTRNYSTINSIAQDQVWSGPVMQLDSKTLTRYGAYQRTTSQGNPFSRLGGKEDIGGGFISHSVRLEGQPAWVEAQSGPRTSGIWYRYRGYISPYYSNLMPNIVSTISPSNLVPYGTRAIARCIPTNPLSGMGQFIGELRDLPKPVDLANWQAIARNFHRNTRRVNFNAISKKAAGEYLNHVFGWVPFVKDLYDFAHVVRNHAKIIRKYAEESGKDLHRSYYFPDEVLTTGPVRLDPVFGSGAPALVDPLYVKKGYVDKTVIETNKRWFKGSFTYVLPPVRPDQTDHSELIDKALKAEAFANKLFGIRPTPDLIYKLLPWSWALDWVTTTGDVVHNWSAFANDGLVMRYGYIMEDKSIRTEFALNGLELLGNPQPVSSTQVLIQQVKSRNRATPFGFGLISTSFTTKQWGIIAALGISRSPRSLNF